MRAAILQALWRRPARPAPRIAVVFLHGYLGVFPRSFYWRHCRPLFEELRRRGFAVVVPRVATTGDVERRALRACRQLAGLAAEKVVLVGHSMGGLDGRGIATHLDADRRVCAVVTLGTPHRGSILAHWAMGARQTLPFLLRRFDRGALRALSPEAAALFNEQVPDRPDVLYRSVVAVRPVAEQARLLQPYGRIVAAEEGPNDGMVSAASQRWGERPQRVRADHFELVGWSLPPQDAQLSRPFDHMKGLREVLAEALRAARAGLSRR